jgi:metal-dependent amidase/aminoacylase/carboxypeptidase family protein
VKNHAALQRHAQAIGNLQHIVSRNTSPLDSVVVSVTRINEGTADNIIPETVELGGTVRSYREEALDGYASVVNDPRLAAIVREAAGADRVVDFAPLMAGEDFSAYSRVAPSCFFFVGAGDPTAYPHHHPRFTIDEAALPIGIETLTRTAVHFLATEAATTDGVATSG